MARWLGAILILSGLALGLCWLARAPERAARVTTVDELVEPAARAGASSGDTVKGGPNDGQALDRPAQGLAPSALESAAIGARESFSAPEWERAHWVTGRVALPPGTPGDEECFVSADGRAFEDGTQHRVRVAADGTFRVAFSPGAKAGWIGLEARYLFLDGRMRWTLDDAPAELVLRPGLGGRVLGAVLAPLASVGGPLVGEIELSNSPQRRIHLTEKSGIEIDVAQSELGDDWQRTLALRRDGEFRFEAVPPGAGLVLEHRGAYGLGRSEVFALAPGETRRVDLQLVSGVALGGRVRDERGRPVADSTIEVLGTPLWTHSDSSGAFRLPALDAGDWTLEVSHDGFAPERTELGVCGLGTRRLALELVLSRGESIGGTLRWADGTPAVVLVHVEREKGPSDAPSEVDLLARPVIVRSSADGRFLVQGLFPGPHKLSVQGRVPGASVHSASLERVEAGTTDLSLRLLWGASPRIEREPPSPATSVTR